MEGVSAARAASVPVISAPARSPLMWTIRFCECAASRPRASSPVAVRSKGAPSRSKSSMRPGASLATSRAISGTQSPAPAAMVSTACASAVSPSPSAAAMPPWAQALDPDTPGRAPAMTREGNGESFSAVKRPATPAPRINAPSVSTTLSLWRVTAPVSYRCAVGWLADRQHAVNCFLRPGGNFGSDFNGMCHRLQRAQNLLERDPLHVRAQIARPNKFDIRMLDRDVVAHGAFGHHHNAARPVLSNITRHSGRRTGEIGFCDDFGRALRMREHDHAGVGFPEIADIGGREPFVDLAAPFPGDDPDGGLPGDVLR